jgi:hypothetical protein
MKTTDTDYIIDAAKRLVYYDMERDVHFDFLILDAVVIRHLRQFTMYIVPL